MLYENLYETLELANFASLEEVRKAYKRLVTKHHPDKNGDRSKLEKVVEAYETFAERKEELDKDLRSG